ncbi:hypothetical protein ILV66_004220 [Salmonella enterica]|nr:hypothetical protein [Salmonella enterica]
MWWQYSIWCGVTPPLPEKDLTKQVNNIYCIDIDGFFSGFQSKVRKHFTIRISYNTVYINSVFEFSELVGKREMLNYLLDPLKHQCNVFFIKLVAASEYRDEEK